MIKDIAAGSHSLSESLKNAERPMIILGSSVFDREDGDAILESTKALCEVKEAPKNSQVQTPKHF